MSLVNELQHSAQSEDVLTVIRKAVRLAAKLDRPDIQEWLKKERDGYSDEDKIPAYRQVSTILRIHTNGVIPVGMGYAATGVVPINHPDFMDVSLDIGQPISSILQWVKESENSKNKIYRTLPEQAQNTLKNLAKGSLPEIVAQVSFVSELSTTDLVGITESVKDKILDWACDLEKAGIIGESETFSIEDKGKAKNLVFNFSGCDIGQLTNSGTNSKEGL